VQDATDNLEQEKDSLLQVVEQFQNDGVQHVTDLFHTFDDVLNQGDGHVQDLQGNLGNLAEKVLSSLEDKFMNAVLGNLSSVFSNLEGGFNLFESLSDTCGGNKDDGLTGILNQMEPVEEIVKIIGPIGDIFSAIVG
jgi:hypothetical protein